MPGFRNKGHGYIASDDEESGDKVAEVQMEIDASKHAVSRAIDKTIQRGDKLEDLEDKAEHMADQGAVFNRQARGVRRHFFLQNLKIKILCAVAVLVVLLIIYFVWIHPLVMDDKDDK